MARGLEALGVGVDGRESARWGDLSRTNTYHGLDPLCMSCASPHYLHEKDADLRHNPLRSDGGAEAQPGLVRVSSRAVGAVGRRGGGHAGARPWSPTPNRPRPLSLPPGSLTGSQPGSARRAAASASDASITRYSCAARAQGWEREGEIGERAPTASNPSLSFPRETSAHALPADAVAELMRRPTTTTPTTQPPTNHQPPTNRQPLPTCAAMSWSARGGAPRARISRSSAAMWPWKSRKDWRPAMGGMEGNVVWPSLLHGAAQALTSWRVEIAEGLAACRGGRPRAVTPKIKPAEESACNSRKDMGLAGERPPHAA